MNKKINIVILTMLLMFQTVLSPILVFADQVIPPITPSEAPLATDAGTSLEGDDSKVASGDSATVIETSLEEDDSKVASGDSATVITSANYPDVDRTDTEHFEEVIKLTIDGKDVPKNGTFSGRVEDVVKF